MTSETIYLNDRERIILLNEKQLTFKLYRSKNILWTSLGLALLTIVVLKLFLNFGIGELMIITIMECLFLISVFQATELVFNIDNKQILRQYSFFGKTIRKKMMKKYIKFSYQIKYDKKSDGENEISGYFLTVIRRHDQIDLFQLSNKEDARTAENLLKTELNLTLAFIENSEIESQNSNYFTDAKNKLQ